MIRCDVLIVGGGVVGLSLAYELSKTSRSVCVVDQGAIGREASWAGAGILPPANRQTAVHPYDQLRGLSMDLHANWAKQLREESGIDTGFRPCGGIYVARSIGEAASLKAWIQELREMQIPHEPLSGEDVVRREPALRQIVERGQVKASYWLPGECQLRNPHHLRALATASERRGVSFLPQHGVSEFCIANGVCESVRCGEERISATQICITSGAWSYSLLKQLSVPTGIMPIRGQMLLFQCDEPPFRAILNEGPRYMVARDDGHVLAGSTEEECGFDKGTTIEARSDLFQFASTMVPQLTEDRLVRQWAGLRPGSFDGMPYLGAIPGVDNVFMASGHFRSGLYLSPATAVVMRQLLEGTRPEIDLSPFRVGRG